MRRRRFLDAAAAAGMIGLAGCSGESDRDGAATDSPSDTAETGQETSSARRRQTTATESAPAGPDFVWAEQKIWRDERVRENLFAFAARHDLVVVIAKADADADDLPALEKPLAAAARHGTEVWLNVGVLKQLTPSEFVGDGAKRRRHLDGLEAVVRRYRDFFPTGRIVLWQEAPVGGRWNEDGTWNDRAVENLERLGPRIFAAQKRRVENVAPNVDVGIFVHFPYIVDGKQPETFETLTADLKSRGALPDFTFTDFYRGWYAKDVGPGPANAAVRSLVTNARELTDDRPVSYLGEPHTINPQYTPSRQAMWMDLRAALGAGAEGVGWYARTAYKETKHGFDPFVPNVGPAARDGPRASTLTFARDRYQYAYAALRAKRDSDMAGGRGASERRFDLWLAGSEFDFYEHRLSLRTRAGEWQFVGDFDGYVDGDYPYGDGSDQVSIFRGLSRERFDRDGSLEVAVETASDSDGARLDAVLAMPEDVSTYLAEPAATELYGSRTDVHEFGVGHERVNTRLAAGDSRRFGVELGEPQRPLDELVFPDHRTQRERLGRLESRDRFDPDDYFDLWVSTETTTEDGSESGSIEELGLVGDDGRKPLSEASTAVSTADGGAVWYGIDRSDLANRDGSITVEVTGDARELVTGVYAMPYAGTVTFRPAAEAMELLETDRASARTFAIAHEEE
ncbi:MULTISPECIES: hypothetical protein [Halococcus]|uniref:Uncharacterized protein n=1 Tax=Halococcus salifodinae DSM 8989 TaxID=1227456 RepID=M0NDC9_9EURY|nr:MULTISPECIES: hypothetical protein [Halococcus]EMA55084.1 hypothetical protein C450_03417 [Halococcus salifodinae DSM 8989]